MDRGSDSRWKAVTAESSDLKKLMTPQPLPRKMVVASSWDTNLPLSKTTRNRAVPTRELPPPNERIKKNGQTGFN